MREERFEGAFQREAFPSWWSKADGARGTQSEAAPKSEGSRREAVFGACAGLALSGCPFEDGKASAVMPGNDFGVHGSRGHEPSTDSVAASSYCLRLKAALR